MFDPLYARLPAGKVSDVWPTHMFLFAFKDQETAEQYQVARGRPINEIVHRKDVALGDNGNAVLLHSGENIFAGETAHPTGLRAVHDRRFNTSTAR